MGSTGRRVGPYMLGPEIGRGAQGVVHEATDDRLRRKVALKALPEELMASAEQQARLAREARLLAAVQHPNVATVYGVVEEGGELWLALELITGETLAEALQRGPLRIEEALDVARQIAAGLEAAHECGVVHRDLKPANAKRAADGTVKVLDFGLAKPLQEDLSTSSALSTDGVVVGTPQYMSPEQLRGKPVDRRCDIWALGCVTWELLSGRRPFDAESSADVLSGILEREPDLAELPARTPARVRELLVRCLNKDPRQRLRDVGDARLELESALAERAWVRRQAAAAPPAGLSGRGAALALGLAAVAALAGFWLGGPDERAAQVRLPLRLKLAVPAGEKATHPDLSPDGRILVHEIGPRRGPEGRHLLARSLDSFEDVPIPGTERVEGFAFSPEGERLAILRASEGTPRRELVLVDVDGAEPPVFVGFLPENQAGKELAWLGDGRIVLAARPQALLLVDAEASGAVEELPIVCDPRQWPNPPQAFVDLPGTGRVLASSFRLSGSRATDSVVTIDLSSGELVELLEDSSCAAWLPAAGRLLFSRADVLLAAPFDPGAGRVGEAEPIARGLRAVAMWGSAPFRASSTGSVVWFPGGVRGADRVLSWVDGRADPAPWTDDPLPIEGVIQVDPTAEFVSVIVVGPAGNWELWGTELDEPGLRPLRAEATYDYRSGMASVADRELYFTRVGPEGDELRRTALDAPDEGTLLYRDASGAGTLFATRLVDGQQLVVKQYGPERTRLLAFDLKTDELPLRPRVLFEVPRSSRAEIAPDGRWVVVLELPQGLVLWRLEEDGSLGPRVAVPTPGLDVRSATWANEPDGSTQRILLWSEGTFDVHEIAVQDAPGGPTFSAPRCVTDLAGKRFWDAAHVSEDRFVGVVVDEEELEQDQIHLLVGAVPR